MTAPLLIHLHIPKNAGTTLSRLIKAKLGFWPPTNLIHHSQVLGYYYLKHARRFEKIQSLSPRARRRVRFVEAHAGYGLHEVLPEPSAYITMLRDPIDRTLSAFAYQKQHNRIDADLTLEQWVRQGDAQHLWHVDNAQVRYLAGDRGAIIDVPHGEVTNAMLDVACERLSNTFLLVGLTEQFDASVILLRRMMGWRACTYGRSNVTKSRQRVDEIPDATLEVVREFNRLDLALYDHARSLLEDRIAAEGESFTTELAEFEQHMTTHGEKLARRYKLLGFGRKLRRNILNKLVR